MRRILKRLPKGRDGFGLAEAVVAIGILGIVAAGGTALGAMFLRSQQKTNSSTSILQMRDKIIETLRSSDALAKLSADSNNTSVANIGCLKTMQNCATSSTPAEPFTIIDRSGNYLTRHAMANFGFGVDQQTCATFPSLACPFRYSVTWQSYCDASVPDTCKTPQLVAQGTLSVAPEFKVPLDLRAFNFKTSLRQMIGSYEQSCTSVGGTYVAADPPRCDLPFSGDCAAGEVVTGFSKAANSKSCRPYFDNVLNNKLCANGEVMQATAANGDPICKTIIAAPPPGATPIPYCDKFPTDPVCQAVFLPTVGDGSGDGGCGDGGGGC